jgi:hypothetical protein
MSAFDRERLWPAGIKPMIDTKVIEALKAEGVGLGEIAKRLNIGRASVYRLLAKSPAFS